MARIKLLDHNDSGLHYNFLTEYLTILVKANLALDRIVNYDRKVKHKLNRTFMIFIGL
jgi:hypothetical protein